MYFQYVQKKGVRAPGKVYLNRMFVPRAVAPSFSSCFIRWSRSHSLTRFCLK